MGKLVNLIHRVSEERFYSGKHGNIIKEETFKTLLKEKVEVSLRREILVLESDVDNNKLVLKKYITLKHAKLIKFKSGYKKYELKTTSKVYTSLTLYKGNKGFSTYFVSDITKPYVRTNIVNNKVIIIIRELLDGLGLISNKEVYGFLGVFIDNVKDNKTSLFNLKGTTNGQLLLNYVLGRFLNGYDLIYDQDKSIEVAKVFRLNKKAYGNKTIYDYLSDKCFLPNPHMIKEASDFRDKHFPTESLDLTILSIYYHLGYNWGDISVNTGMISNTINPYGDYFKFTALGGTNYINDDGTKKFLSLVSKHKNGLSDMSVVDVIRLVNNLIIIQDVYGLSINESFLDLEFTEDIISQLYDTVINTGIFVPKENLIKSLKRSVKKGYRFAVGSDRYDEKDHSFGTVFNDPTSIIKIFNDKGRLTHSMRIGTNSTYVDIKIESPTSKKLEMFSDRVSSNKFGLNVRGLYSKSRFENYITEKYTNISLDDIVYNDK